MYVLLIFQFCSLKTEHASFLAFRFSFYKNLFQIIKIEEFQFDGCKFHFLKFDQIYLGYTLQQFVFNLQTIRRRRIFNALYALRQKLSISIIHVIVLSCVFSHDSLLIRIAISLAGFIFDVLYFFQLGSDSKIHYLFLLLLILQTQGLNFDFDFNLIVCQDNQFFNFFSFVFSIFNFIFFFYIATKDGLQNRKRPKYLIQHFFFFSSASIFDNFRCKRKNVGFASAKPRTSRLAGPFCVYRAANQAKQRFVSKCSRMNHPLFENTSYLVKSFFLLTLAFFCNSNPPSSDSS
eukprot:TRINITY_DN5333_c0_g1_i1.p1 TRINITY_DN5333_c0_g1~~TRINITY_DN5333_c0_g1_i1.p1  ORF type:complete len:298 (+),score=-13.18 TRINITY_DN5333_c0_g1_i1:24-896(+)